MRVSRTQNSETINYIYASNGNLAGEYGSVGSYDKENFYLGSKLLASVKGEAGPVANAGVDQLVDEGSSVTLDASASTSFYGNITSYSWTQISGPTVSLASPSTAETIFSAPAGIYNAELAFQVQVENTAGLVSTDTVVVTIQIIDTDVDGLSDYWEQQYFNDLSQSGSDDNDGDGYSNLEEYQMGDDPLVPQPLADIEGFKSKPGDSSIELSWQPVDRATSYDLYWSTTPDITKANGILVNDITSPYVHTGLNNGQSYYYIVAANNSCCESTSSKIKATPGASAWSYKKIATSSGGNWAGFVNGKAKLISKNSDSDYDYIVIDTYDSNSGQMTSETLIQSDKSLYYIDQPDMVQLPDGSAIAVWIKNDISTSIFSVMESHYVPGLGWTEEHEIWSTTGQSSIGSIGDYGYKDFFNIEVDSNDNAMIFWSERESGNGPSSLYAAPYTIDAGAGPVKKFNSPMSLNGATAKMSESGYAAIAYSVEPSNGEGEYYISRYIPGSGWLDSELIYTEPASPVSTIAVNDDGNVAVFWYNDRFMTNINRDHVIAKRYQPGFGWHKAEDTFLVERDDSFDGGYDGAYFCCTNISAAYDANGNLLVASGVGGDPGNITMGYNKYFEGVGWQTAVEIPQHQGEFNGCCEFGYDYALVPDDFGNINVIVHEYMGTYPDYSIEVLDYAITSTGDIKAPSVVYSFTGAGIGTGGDKLLGAERDNDGNIFGLSLSVEGDLVALTYDQFPGAPNANAGPQQNVDSGTLVTLDATGSVDLDGLISEYNWTQLKGVPVSLSSTASASPGFVAPSVSEPTEIVFELIVKDDAGLAGIDTVKIIVSPQNSQPVADAGADLIVNEASVVYLDGVNSYDLDGSIVSYRWQQLTEPFVQLSYISGTSRSFTVPWILEDTTTQFRLTVTDDGGKSASDKVTITMLNSYIEPPVPVMTTGTGSIYVEELKSVQLDGSGSYAPEGEVVSYSWAQTSGPAVTLEAPDSDKTVFLAPDVTQDTTLTFELTVTDSNDVSASDSIDITVQEPAAPPPPEDTTPPTTNVSITEEKSRGVTYKLITFGGSLDIDKTYFRVAGEGTIVEGGANTTAWQQYIPGHIVKVELAKQGIAYLSFYSIDTSGNLEESRTVALQ